MPKRWKILLIVVISVIVVSLAFGAGCIISFRTPAANIGGPDTGLINQAWDVIARNYVEPEKLDADTLNQGAIKGMVDSIKDPYSAYLTPEDYKLTQTDLQGSFSGIGAQVTLNDNNQLSSFS